MPSTPTPGQTAPELDVELVSGGRFTLADAEPEQFTLVVFYRGLHCPVCEKYNGQLEKLLPKFAERGVDVVAVSMDDADRAQETVDQWGLDELAVGHGLSEQAAREWGLYLSSSIKEDEPELFSEPGLFLVQPDGDLFYGAVNSMPFGRPDLEAMLDAIDFVTSQDYPSRGRES